MKTHGIPASITLAQGCLESANGNSDLAVRANNHFGIKCHNDWKGPTYYKKGDDPGKSCYRKYRSASESFKDHSDFLRYGQRYAFLFDLQITDYKGWSHGLKKAGYATDPKYAQKLIKIIEDYQLYRFDREIYAKAEKKPDLLPPSPSQLHPRRRPGHLREHRRGVQPLHRRTAPLQRSEEIPRPRTGHSRLPPAQEGQGSETPRNTHRCGRRHLL